MSDTRLYWQHVKTGKIYYKICEAQLESNPTQHMIIYKSVENARELPWARPEQEFYDGRFVPVPTFIAS